MDTSDVASDSSSDSEMEMKKQKLEDDDDSDEVEIDSSPMDEEEEDEIGSSPVDAEEEEKRRYRSMAKIAIGYGINPLAKNTLISDVTNSINPSFTIDNSKLESAVFEMYEEGKEKVKKLLKEAKGKLTLCYEWMVLKDWTSEAIEGPILYEDFIAVSVYFTDEDFKMQKWVLAYHPRVTLRVKDLYVDPLKNVISEYGIESKVSTLLVPNYDDCTVVSLDAFRKWIEERGGNEIKSSVFLIFCCSDVFRLMVDDMSRDLSTCLIDCVRILLGWRQRILTTKWDVTLRDLQIAVDKEAKDEFEDEKYDGYHHPTEEEWIMLRTFCKLTGCIHKVAKELFEGEYPTANVYFHLLAELKVMLKEELKNGDNEYFVNKATEILERFDKYWKSMFLVLATASVLDPRFKMKYLEFYCLKSEVNDEGSRVETVMDYLRNLYAQYAACDIDIPPQQECPDAAVDPYSDLFKYIFEEEEEEEEKPGAYEDFAFFQEYLKFEGSTRASGESELDSYLKEPVLEWNKNFNALEWWRKEGQKYPVLSRVARDIISIPISRGTSHRAYIAGKRYCPDFVVSMEAKLVNAMMCSESWPRF